MYSLKTPTLALSYVHHEIYSLQTLTISLSLSTNHAMYSLKTLIFALFMYYTFARSLSVAMYSLKTPAFSLSISHRFSLDLSIYTYHEMNSLTKITLSLSIYT